MASLTKRPTSQFWVACFIDRRGRRLKKSTATTDRKQAQKIADEFEAAARSKRTALQVRRVITQLHQEITGDDVSQTSVRKFFADWLERKAPEVAESTMDFYRNAAKKFLTFLGEAAEADLAEISRDHITRFRNNEAKRLASKTVNHQVKFLRMIFRAARRDILIADDPAEFVETVRKGRATGSRRPFTVPELKAVLTVADAEWKSMVLFGLYTGQRLGDISMLTEQNIHLQQEEIRFVTRKTRKTMIVPIAPPLLRHIEARKTSDDPEAPLHPRAFGIVTRRGKSGHLSNLFADVLSDAGLRLKKSHRRNTLASTNGRGRGSSTGGLSFHCLRHTAVTLMKEAGIPAAVVMELVGHDSEQMSEIYTHVGAEAMKKAAASLPDVV